MTESVPTWRTELREMAALGAPIVVVQLGMRAMSTVDVMMVGHYSEQALGSVATGNAWVWCVTIFCMGIVMAADPLLSQAVGAKDDAAISRHLQRGLVLVCLLTVPAMAVIAGLAGPIMAAVGTSEAVVAGAVDYASIVALGTLPTLAFSLLRSAMQSFGAVAVIVFVIVLTNGINVVANYALIYGHWGLPELGTVGSAWATVLGRWLMALLLLWVGWSQLGRHVCSFADSGLRRRALRPGAIGRTLLLGLPIGTQLALELGVFAATTFAVGTLGVVELDGHQVALDIASVTFMVPMALGMAASVRVGRAIGRGDMAGARRAAGVALGVIAVIEVGFAAMFLGFPSALAGIYTQLPAVVAMGAALLPIAGVFQVFDGLQAVAAGVLRGLGETRIPMLVSLVGFWLLGFPVGWWLCFARGDGAAGMWWGLVVGLGAVAVLLVALVRVRMRQEHARLHVD